MYQNYEQIETVKKYLKSGGVADKELNLVTYEVIPVLEKDAYQAAFRRLSDNELLCLSSESYGVAKSMDKQIDTLRLSYEKIKCKNYFRVLATER